jgi:hypothetical protein
MSTILLASASSLAAFCSEMPLTATSARSVEYATDLRGARARRVGAER